MISFMLKKETDHYVLALYMNGKDNKPIEVIIRALTELFDSATSYTVELVNMDHNERLFKRFIEYAKKNALAITQFDLVAPKQGRRYYLSNEYRAKLYEKQKIFGLLEARIRTDFIDELLTMAVELFWEHTVVLFSK